MSAATEPVAPGIPAIIQEQLDRLAGTARQMLDLVPDANAAAQIAALFAAEIPGIYARASHLGDSIWIEAAVTSMTQVVAIRRECARLGYHLDNEWGVQDYPEERRQTYGLGRITLNVRFPGGEGAACQFKQTGTKTVPTYELVSEGTKP